MNGNVIRSVVLAAVAMFAGGVTADAQYGPPPQQHGPWDDAHWGQGPQGYNDYYREQGAPNYSARRGYSAGFEMGMSDRNNGHSFRPTHLDEYKHLPDRPPGISQDEYKHIYREAFIHGYERGYGR